MARGRVFLILGVVLALLSGVAVFQVANSSRAQAVVKQPVLIALVDVPARTFVTDANVKTYFGATSWPVDIKPPQAISSTAQVLNHVVVDKIAKGAPVMLTNITDNTSSGQTGLSVDIIPKDFVAESLSVSEANSVAGNIQVGDYVDILLSEPPLKATVVAGGTPASQPAANATASNAGFIVETTLITQTTLQHVRVIAVGTKSVAGNAPQQSGQQPTTNAVPTSLTLLLSHQDALIVKHLKDVGYQVDLVLRRNDDTKADTVTTPVTRDYIDTKFGFNLHTPTAGAAPK